MKSLAQHALEIAKGILADAPVKYVPPSAGTIPTSQNILPHALLKNTRGYIERVVFQINAILFLYFMLSGPRVDDIDTDSEIIQFDALDK